jgi:hypothetical protein
MNVVVDVAVVVGCVVVVVGCVVVVVVGCVVVVVVGCGDVDEDVVVVVGCVVVVSEVGTCEGVTIGGLAKREATGDSANSLLRSRFISP